MKQMGILNLLTLTPLLIHHFVTMTVISELELMILDPSDPTQRKSLNNIYLMRSFGSTLLQPTPPPPRVSMPPITIYISLLSMLICNKNSVCAERGGGRYMPSKLGAETE